MPVHLYDMTCGDQLRALADGKVDLGFVGSWQVRERSDLRSRPIAAYKTVAALPKNHHFATPLNREAERPRADVFRRYIGTQSSWLSTVADGDL